MRVATRTSVSIALTWIVGGCTPPSIPITDTDTATGDVPFPDPDRLADRDPSACLLDDNPACEGHPAADADDYGFGRDDVLANYLLYDCDGQPHELAELFAPRPDTTQYNRGVVIALGALW